MYVRVGAALTNDKKSRAGCLEAIVEYFWERLRRLGPKRLKTIAVWVVYRKRKSAFAEGFGGDLGTGVTLQSHLTTIGAILYKLLF
jgi:hypothetical protein